MKEVETIAGEVEVTLVALEVATVEEVEVVVTVEVETFSCEHTQYL